MISDLRQLALNVTGGLLVVATLGFLAFMTWGLVEREIALSNKDAMMMALGVFLAKYSDLIAFFFGSSHTNKRQAETVEKLASTVQAHAPSSPSIPVSPGESVTVEGKE